MFIEHENRYFKKSKQNMKTQNISDID